VMNFHGARIDVRLERGVVVSERRQCESHFIPPVLSCEDP
jgi:hypothetical protein